MGTRGALGFRKDGVEKITYNHFDSYPTYLGGHVLEFVSNMTVEDMAKIFDKIEMVEMDGKPTPEQIEECKQYANIHVSKQTVEEWYCLLREAQGDLNAYKNDLRYMIDAHDFLDDDLFCEWGYVIDLDKAIVEIYKNGRKMVAQVSIGALHRGEIDISKYVAALETVADGEL